MWIVPPIFEGIYVREKEAVSAFSREIRLMPNFVCPLRLVIIINKVIIMAAIFNVVQPVIAQGNDREQSFVPNLI